jgi:hypothetical protein
MDTIYSMHVSMLHNVNFESTRYALGL